MAFFYPAGMGAAWLTMRAGTGVDASLATPAPYLVGGGLVMNTVRPAAPAVSSPLPITGGIFIG